MKKSNTVTFLSLCFIIVAVIMVMFFWKTPSAGSATETENDSVPKEITVSSTTKDTNTPGDTNLSEDTSPSESITDTSTSSTESTQTATESSAPELPSESMGKALFIGDSRTVGLMEYAGIENADFFCTVGMSVYDIHKKPVSVPNVGKVTLTELLKNKKYDRIYIMLGINEVGYKFSSTVATYSELLDFIQNNQPDSKVFIQANLHVTQSRSDSDKVVNNPAINGLNSELSKLADGKTKFYLDANILFDDANGSLSADKTGDSTHLYAKYYVEWGKWIIRQTASLIGEG